MFGQIIGENTLVSQDDKKEYFCTSLNLREIGADFGDIVEFIPKGSRAIITKLIEKSSISQKPNSAINSSDEKLCQNRYDNLNSHKPTNSTKNEKQNAFESLNLNDYKENSDKFEDDDFWDENDMQKSTQEYMQQSENLKNKKSLKTLVFIIFIFFIINFFISLANSVKVIKFNF
ncbi:MAG: hypothetical protein IJM31_09400 [Campylobacter sp.]|nr:hypothetical protein [Campylobacter sp.]